jgi:threonyl-tRNA synthetase
MFSEKVGQGLPLWLPKGTALAPAPGGFFEKRTIKRGYQPVITPHIGSKKLYVTSDTGKNTARILSSPSSPLMWTKSFCSNR